MLKYMNTTLTKTTNLWRVALIDVALLTVGCLIPTVSHIVALPLYQLNPMLLVLLAGMLLVGDRGNAAGARAEAEHAQGKSSGSSVAVVNALLLAVLLPLVWMLAVGMPTPLKALCMVAELTTVVLVGNALCRMKVVGRASGSSRFWAIGSCMLVAMLCGKVVYYAMKSIVLTSVSLVTTPVLTQAVVLVAAAMVYALFENFFN